MFGALVDLEESGSTAVILSIGQQSTESGDRYGEQKQVSAVRVNYFPANAQLTMSYAGLTDVCSTTASYPRITQTPER